MHDSIAKPALAINVVWHPEFSEGQKIADSILSHYSRDCSANFADGLGIPVLHYSKAVVNSDPPSGLDIYASHACANIFLVDESFTSDPKWIDFFNQTGAECQRNKFSTLAFPIVFSKKAMEELSTKTQAVRYYEWETLPDHDRLTRLIAGLSYEFCRMLRAFLESLKNPKANKDDLESYLKKVNVFLSHSKHDAVGEALSKKLRKFIQDDIGLSSFFDAIDIPPGLHFDDVLVHCVQRSALVAIHSDTYSSREWCRREILEAKLHGQPIVVVNCLVSGEERGFPYLGNVPVIRVEPGFDTRIHEVISKLLDEVLRGLYWDCSIHVNNKKHIKGVEFIPRQPELLTIARYIKTAAGKSPRFVSRTLVYPDPPLSREEEILFEKMAPGVDIKSYRQWQRALIASK